MPCRECFLKRNSKRSIYQAALELRSALTRECPVPRASARKKPTMAVRAKRMGRTILEETLFNTKCIEWSTRWYRCV